MQKQFIFFIILSVLVAIFAITNAEVMTVRLFFWTFELSGSLVILLSVLLGALLVILFGMVSWIKKKLLVKDLRRELDMAKKHVEQCTTEKEQLMVQVQDLKAEIKQMQLPKTPTIQEDSQKHE